MANIYPYDNIPRNSMSIPMVIKRTPEGERGYDIFSRILEDRVVMLCGEVNEDSAQLIIAQLLYLESVDAEKDITLYINSPGGSISDGMAIFDTMNYIKPDVSTVCVGLAASMGSFLFMSGAKGKRFILPNAEVMIHQPLGGTKGQATDMDIAVQHIKHVKNNLAAYMADITGKDINTILRDIDRDNWLTAEQAVDYGIADKILKR